MTKSAKPPHGPVVRADFHPECFDQLLREREQRIEEFAASRLVASRLGLPAFAVRWNTAEFAERVANQRLLGAAERYHVGLGNIGFIGPAGTGKTETAKAIFLRLGDEAAEAYRASRGRNPELLNFAARMHWTNAATLAAARKQHRLGAGEAPEVERAESASWLVLDELGQEQGDDRWLLEFLDVRYARGLPTISTAGITQAELAHRYGMGACRRLVEPHGHFVDLFEASKAVRRVGLSKVGA